MRTFIIILLLAATALGGGWFWQQSQDTVEFRTTDVHQGTLLIAVSATGTIEPEELIDVGAQVVGRISEFGQGSGGSIDFGSRVKQGTVLAKIDDSLYQTSVAQAEANLKVAQAELERARARLKQAERDWERAQQLGNAIPESERDQALAAFEVAQADLQVSQARVEQTQAALKQAQVNLGYTTIRSPIDGVVIDRRVDVGQTVVSGLNAPSLFLLAKDMSKMRVRASVNEADIGSIHLGQKATFTVDAYPERTFDGVVTQVRLNAAIVQNVVTYSVIVTADNESGKLLPYMTANIQFEVARREDALLVPNQALRWLPAPDQVVPGDRPLLEKLEAADEEFSFSAGASEKSSAATRDYLWVDTGGVAQAVLVETGLSDGVMTELVGDVLPAGSEVIIGEIRRQDRRGFGNNFVPKRKNRFNQDDTPAD